MDLNSLIIFGKVAESGSFTVAAQQLRMPKSAVSQKISALEGDLGVRLLHRTTRSVSLTEVGERVYRAAAVLSEQRDIIKAITESVTDEPSGVLNITAPPDIGTYLIGSLFKDFMRTNPRVQLRVDLSARFVDLVQEGFDVAIRATLTGLQDSSLVSVKIGELPMGVFVAKGFEGTAKINTPEDLKRVEKVSFSRRTESREGTKWTLDNGKKKVEIDIQASLRTNDYQAVLAAVRSGYGYGVMPALICKADVEAGKLLPILPKWRCGLGAVYAVFPSKTLMPRKTSVFLDFLKVNWPKEG